MTSVINVNLPEQSYEIAIAPGSLDQLGEKMTSLQLGKKVLVVSNPTIFKHYGDRAINSLKTAGFEVSSCILPAGERFKNLNSIQKIYDAALENRLERSATIVALGGGVIGDMAGFAAATWLRGISVVQVPTTLLAMVDSAIGGKTGVNHPQGKNLIGAFHQPRLVLIDPEVLKTLPVREFRAGMAEVIKYGVIWDADLFSQMEASKHLNQLRYIKPELIEIILIRSCQAKADVVSKDEKEAGLRAILNYGHTIGHAVESLTGYRLVNHGEAVGIGMVAAGQIAVELGMWQKEETERQNALIQKAGLPTQLPSGVDIAAIIDALQLDKKVKAGKVRFVLPTQIGVVTVTDEVPADTIRQVLQAM
ncbi:MULTISPECIES: 3-dehydroquinate synthase [unclassified Tolypothrix]|uniref:3-dehydroquinate synthase n=1 Tax=unclassified Tolypothrix TaxID=2649714 RepID=UPI0005EABA26|nr:MULTISPECIES: 3-dehydroquinate synthase [unclassified Tolypothrix]BAY94929.1 3-dehydroquinate synthase [Microchaete diplosiphon NIES-3275]EKF00981.1 3-dehydroquinate synthase [Tolypothrix sp. PCC 7601]MBE9082445.1 3-dehydroquinate synthase [Tolypothrix sp. LEGE 11397]UYD28568.1 3-dehydroquinate synthase [Tolypothrix sp. PCC 7712]UYD35521.1 3-dehydroquinate synthase [Tolypothrix sp. PCC 7601]